MEVLAAIFDVSQIYSHAYSFAPYVAVISGLLLVSACYVRVIETQISQGGGLNSWGGTVGSIAIWSFVLGAYALITPFFIGFLNDLMNLSSNMGSVKLLLYQFDQFYEHIDAKSKAEANPPSVFSSEFWLNLGSTLGMAVPAAVSLLLYKISLYLLIALAGFLKYVQAILFSIAYIMGYIIIPLAVSKSLKITPAWKGLVFFIFLWPVMEGIVLGMYSGSIVTALRKAQAGTNHSATFDAAAVASSFTIINVISLGLLIVAPILSYLFASASANNQGFVQPTINMVQKSIRFRFPKGK